MGCLLCRQNEGKTSSFDQTMAICRGEVCPSCQSQAAEIRAIFDGMLDLTRLSDPDVLVRGEHELDELQKIADAMSTAHRWLEAMAIGPQSNLSAALDTGSLIPQLSKALEVDPPDAYSIYAFSQTLIAYDKSRRGKHGALVRYRTRKAGSNSPPTHSS